MRSIESTSSGNRISRNTVLSRAKAITEKTRKAAGIQANTCHMSAVMNSTSEKTSRSGNARTKLATELASSRASWRIPQTTVAMKP